VDTNFRAICAGKRVPLKLYDFCVFYIFTGLCVGGKVWIISSVLWMKEPNPRHKFIAWNSMQTTFFLTLYLSGRFSPLVPNRSDVYLTTQGPTTRELCKIRVNLHLQITYHLQNSYHSLISPSYHRKNSWSFPPVNNGLVLTSYQKQRRNNYRLYNIINNRLRLAWRHYSTAKLGHWMLSLNHLTRNVTTLDSSKLR